MGIREILEVTCPQCGFEDDDVPFAPTCDFVTWKCPECGFIVDLMAMTGISYEDASNADEIAKITEMCEFTRAGWDKLHDRLLPKQAEMLVGFENELFPYIWHDNLNGHDHSKSCSCCLGAPGDNDSFRPILCKCDGPVSYTHLTLPTILLV